MRRIGHALTAALVVICGCGVPRSSVQRPDTRRAVRFLADLFDPDVDLLPEYAGAKDYWLFHDNYLAARMLRRTHPKLSARIEGAMRRHGVTRSGKIEIVFGEAPSPLPFRQPELVTVARTGDRRIRTERLTDRVAGGWRAYADLLLLAALAENDPARARRHYDDALALWDGVGFNDQATRALSRYSTYKLPLALLAARKLDRPLPMRDAILRRLAAQQHPSGGFVTDYGHLGKPIGLANVETTCLVLLALRGA